MIFSSRNQSEIKIFILNMELSNVSAEKYLRVTLDEELVLNGENLFNLFPGN